MAPHLLIEPELFSKGGSPIAVEPAVPTRRDDEPALATRFADDAAHGQALELHELPEAKTPRLRLVRK